MNSRPAFPPGLRDFLPIPEGRKQYPLEFARHHRLIKLREDHEQVIVGTTNPLPRALRTRLENFHHKSIASFNMEESDLRAYLSRLELSSPHSNGSGGGSATQLPELSDDAPAAQLLAAIIANAVQLGASDLHLEQNAEGAALRLRIDGVLETVDHLDPGLFPYLANRVKLLSRLNIMETRRPQDGRMSCEVSGARVDCRVATLRSHVGESIVIRFFPRAAVHETLDDLGFRRIDQVVIEASVKRPSGLFLVTGPTGSGKSTTLNVLLRLLNSNSRKLITIEDPIEQIIPGVLQTQTHDAIGLGFDSILRSVLRHDPDIIMVGEVRDPSTAEQVIRASLTGHLVLSTLHTKGSLSAVSRLEDLGVPGFLIAEVLQAVSAQRLVRRLCPHCRRARSPSARERRLFESSGLPIETVFEAAGCPRCRRTGYEGRLPLLELFRPDDQTRETIARGTPIDRLDPFASLWSGRHLFRDGLLRIMEGATTVDEVRAVVDFE